MKNRVRLCARIAGYPRFHTWALVDTAYACSYMGGVPAAIRSLKQANIVLSARGYMMDDPIIAKDLGGPEILAGIRQNIRSAITSLKSYDFKSAKKEISHARAILYDNAILKFIECVLDENKDLNEGISTKRRLHKVIVKDKID